MMFLNKDFKLFNLMGHFQKNFFGLGIAGETFGGCDDDCKFKYTCYNIKIYIGPLIFNFLCHGPKRPVKIGDALPHQLPND
jgi:hypothetical protein